jgi:hypothetical protein
LSNALVASSRMSTGGLRSILAMARGVGATTAHVGSTGPENFGHGDVLADGLHRRRRRRRRPDPVLACW